MKNHIFFKFLGVFLCALMLLSALGCGAGIFALAAMGLNQEKTVDAAYEQNAVTDRNWAAQQIAKRYASRNLGHCPQELVYEFYGYQPFGNVYREGSIFYTIQDSDGKALESTYSGQSGVTSYAIAVNTVNYVHIVEGPVPERDVILAVPEMEMAEETYGTTRDESMDFALASQESEATSLWLTMEDGEAVVYRYTYRQSPGYNVILYLAPEARTTDAAWRLLQMVWNYRKMVTIALGVSLLLFAVFAVYLCCAAGRSPKSTEIRPGGINRLPIDLYAFLAAVLLGLIIMLMVEGGEYLLRQGLSISAVFAIYGGYMCCLLFVGFCFAFAAQVKTPGGFLWRNSLCGRCFLLAARFCRWLYTHVPILVAGIFRWGWKLAARIWKAGCKFLTWILLQIFAVVSRIWQFVRRIAGVIGGACNRLYSRLPLIWQWLLVAFFMVVILAYTINARHFSESGALLGIGICAMLVLYGANTFGALLESVKRMRGGNLESKVDDRLMVGGFREFAQELNGLADVAVVAAQQQLKSERMKTELITNVSHDIKTPLTSIINYVDLLQKPHTEEEEASYLEVLSRQSQRMKKLIEDLMEMSKASTGNVTVEITEIDAAEAVNQALGEFADKLDSVRLIPVFHQPEQTVMMLADGRLLWRAMSNVLSNAVKYALPGTRLYVDLDCVDGKVLISFKNISREQLNITADELLERFVRGDSSRNTEGSGLGLNIAKSLLEVQHGQLQLLVDGDLFKVTMIFPGA